MRQLRLQMARPGDHPDEHLGEAETITIIRSRRLRALIATHDNGAARWADPVQCVGTWRLVKLALRKQSCSLDDALGVWQAFVDAGGHPPRDARTVQEFRQWLESDW